MHRAQAMIDDLAWRDPLTSLANRALFLNRLEQTLSNTILEGLIAYVLLLDIDRFKNINEAYGLITGDTLLKAVSSTLQSGAAYGRCAGVSGFGSLPCCSPV